MSETKNTNPKDAVGTSKVTFSTLPVQVLAEWALAMHEGALKYGRHNFRASGVRASVYFDAALRHLFAFWEGQDIDPDSGVPHIVKAIACFGVLRDSQLQGNWVDDRPPRAADQDWIKKANERTKELLARIPEEKRVPAYTEVGRKVEVPSEPVCTEFCIYARCVRTDFWTCETHGCTEARCTCDD